MQRSAWLPSTQKKPPNTLVSDGFLTAQSPNQGHPGSQEAAGWLVCSVELLFFSRTRQSLHRRRTTLNHGGHIVKVACADFLLV